jgi:hypothetical protein
MSIEGYDATNPSKITVYGAAQELPFVMSAVIRQGLADSRHR